MALASLTCVSGPGLNFKAGVGGEACVLWPWGPFIGLLPMPAWYGLGGHWGLSFLSDSYRVLCQVPGWPHRPGWVSPARCQRGSRGAGCLPGRSSEPGKVRGRGFLEQRHSAGWRAGGGSLPLRSRGTGMGSFPERACLGRLQVSPHFMFL